MTTRWISVRLDGVPIEDVFVYRTSLFAWTYDSTIWVFEIDAIEHAIRQSLVEDPQAAEAACFQLFHSNGVGANVGQHKYMNVVGERDADIEIFLDAESIPHEIFQTHLEANSLLDVLVYSDRTYAGTDEGLFQLIPPEPGVRTVLFSKRIDYACHSVSASLGSVAASCGEAGLRVLFNDFNYLAGRPSQQRNVAPLSDRATFGSGGLFNFASRDMFTFLDGESEASTLQRSRVPDQVLVGVEPVETFASSDEQRSLFLEDGLDYTLFSRQRLIALRDGQLSASRLRRDEYGRRIVNTVHKLGRYQGRPLSVCETSSTVLIETSTGLFSAEGASEGVDFLPVGPTVSLRTFPNSKRYLELVSRTAEDATYLLAAIPKHGYTEPGV